MNVPIIPVTRREQLQKALGGLGYAVMAFIAMVGSYSAWELHSSSAARSQEITNTNNGVAVVVKVGGYIGVDLIAICKHEHIPGCVDLTGHKISP